MHKTILLSTLVLGVVCTPFISALFGRSVKLAEQVALDWRAGSRELPESAFVRDWSNQVAVRVQDDHGQPIVGAHVAIFRSVDLDQALAELEGEWPMLRPEASNVTDSRGTATALNLERGPKEVVISCEGFRPETLHNVIHQDGYRTKLEVILSSQTPRLIHILDWQGKPCAGKSVLVYPSSLQVQPELLTADSAGVLTASEQYYRKDGSVGLAIDSVHYQCDYTQTSLRLVQPGSQIAVRCLGLVDGPASIALRFDEGGLLTRLVGGGKVLEDQLSFRLPSTELPRVVYVQQAQKVGMISPWPPDQGMPSNFGSSGCLNLTIVDQDTGELTPGVAVWSSPSMRANELEPLFDTAVLPVRPGGRVSASDALTRFTMCGPAQLEGTLTVSAPTYASKRVSAVLDGSSRTISLEKGFILDVVTSRPFTTVVIETANVAMRARTDAYGQLRRSVPRGPLSLHTGVDKGGMTSPQGVWMSTDRELRVVSSDKLETHCIYGFVTSGKPIAGGLIHYGSNGGPPESTTTSTEGFYCIADVPDDVHVAKVEIQGCVGAGEIQLAVNSVGRPREQRRRLDIDVKVASVTIETTPVTEGQPLQLSLHDGSGAVVWTRWSRALTTHCIDDVICGPYAVRVLTTAGVSHERVFVLEPSGAHFVLTEQGLK